MSARLWLDEVERELSRRKLPRHEVARLLAELSDHFADVMESRSVAGPRLGRAAENGRSVITLTEEQNRMEATIAESLGSPIEIADTAAREFRRRRNLLFRSRLAAFCTFVLLPLPVLGLTWIASRWWALVLPGMFLNCRCSNPVSSANPEATKKLAERFASLPLRIGICIAASAGIAVVFFRLARKSPESWRWGLAACLLAAPLSSFMVAICVCNLPPSVKQEARDTLGVFFASPLVLIGTFIAPAAGIATAFSRLACKTAHFWQWGLAACLLVALGATLVGVYSPSSNMPANSLFCFGIDLPATDFFRIAKLGQFLIPLATGCLVLRRSAAPGRFGEIPRDESDGSDYPQISQICADLLIWPES